VEGSCVPRTCHAIKLLSPAARVSIPQLDFGVGWEDFTWEMWVKYHGEFSVSGESVLFFMNEADPELGGLRLILDGTGRPVCRYADQATPQTLLDNPSSGTITDGAWHNVACSRAGGALYTELDGELVRGAGQDVYLRTAYMELSTAAVGAPLDVEGTEAAPVVIGPMRAVVDAVYTVKNVSNEPQLTWPTSGGDAELVSYLVSAGATESLLPSDYDSDPTARATLVTDAVPFDEDSPCDATREAD
jgi:hypothetical protein